MRATAKTRHRATQHFFVLLAVLIFFAPAARANTYLFSFTASEALAALQASVGTQIENQSAYYNIFVQPDPAVVYGYTYSSVTSPNANDATAWQTNTITDPSSPNLGFDSLSPCSGDCTFAHWGKGYTQSSVAVMSNANGTGAIFVNGQYADNATAPYGWGPTLATISTIMPGADKFQFIINTTQTLSGTYHLIGYASALVSGSSSGFTAPIKDSEGIPFDLYVSATAQTVPEPAGFVPVLTGTAILFWRWRKRPSRRS